MIGRYVLFAFLALSLSAPFSVAGVLSGKVYDAKGRPVIHYRLWLLETGAGQRVSLETDQQGQFSRDLPQGEYTILSAGEGQERTVAQFSLRNEEDRTIVLRLFPDDVLEAEALDVDSLSPQGAGSAAEPDADLRAIRDYRIMQAASTGAPLQESMRLAESVNPFPAQKRGRIHGSLYEFHRNDNFDARNFFDPVGEKLPEYKRNQFGATLGASITGNMNAFAAYDGVRIIQGSTLLSHVPTVAQKEGDFSALDIVLRDPITGAALEDNRFPATLLHPVAVNLLELLPDPNRDDPSRNYVNSRPIVQNRDSLSTRLDYQWAPGSNLFARYAYNRSRVDLVHPVPGFGSNRQDASDSIDLSWNQKLNGRLLLSTSFGFDRFSSGQISVNAGKTGLLSSLGIDGVAAADDSEEGYPDFRVAGYVSFGDGGLPVFGVNNRYALDASLSYTPSAHSIRAGGEVGWYQSNNNRSDGVRRGRFTFNGYYTGDSFGDFLTGVPDTATRGIGSDRTDLRRRWWSVYLRDQWRLSPRLTLSGGISYVSFPPFRSANNNISGFFPLVFEPPLDGKLVSPGTPEASELGLDAAGSGGLVFPDRNDFAPSFGIAYRPLGNNRMVGRASYSISYNPLGRDSYVAYLGRNYPYFYLESALSPVDEAQIDLAKPFSNARRNEIGVRGIETFLRTSYIQHWRGVLEGEVLRNWYFSTGYEGDKGTHMPRLIPGNVPLPGAGEIQPRRPNPDYGRFSIETGGGSYSRNAMELSLERRLQDGFSVRAGYSWDVSMNDTYRSAPSNPRNLAAERSVSSFSAGRRFWTSYILDLPFGKDGRYLADVPVWIRAAVSGWRLSGITRFNEGGRVNVTAAGDPNNDGVGEDRPDRVSLRRLDPSERSIDRWFSVEDFEEAAPFSFGNSGRNTEIAPGYANWDLSVIRQIGLTDGQFVEFRLEMFNAFNQVNFDAPYSVFGTSSFGQIFGARRAREMEVAVRYSF